MIVRHLVLLLNIMSSCTSFANWGSQMKIPGTARYNMSTNSDHCVKTCDVLSLESIRSTLIRQEETIIFALIERAQFRHNAIVYDKGGFGDLGTPLGSKESNEKLSFLEYMLVGTVSLILATKYLIYWF